MYHICFVLKSLTSYLKSKKDILRSNVTGSFLCQREYNIGLSTQNGFKLYLQHQLIERFSLHY